MRNGWSIMVERAVANQKPQERFQKEINLKKDEPATEVILVLVVLGVVFVTLMMVFA